MNNGEKKPLTPEQLAAQIAQQKMMAAAYAVQQRQAIATACLSGILSGLYSNPELLVENFGDKAINDACVFADKLQARLLEDARKSVMPPPEPKLPGESPPAPADAPPAANA